jgi:hypothetical protein
MPDPMDDQRQHPDLPPNNPNSYTPTDATKTVAPVVAQVTGGNAGATIAGVQGATDASNNFFGDIGAAIGKVANQLGAVFNAGKAVGSGVSAPVIEDLAQKRAAAIVQKGIADAATAGMDGMHKALAADQVRDDALRLGAGSDQPKTQQLLSSIGEAGTQMAGHLAAINKASQKGFLEDPASWLINHIVTIPSEQNRANINLGVIKAGSAALAADSETIQSRTVVDNAVNSIYTKERAQSEVVSGLAAAAAAGYSVLSEGKQLEISAYQLANEQERTRIANAHLKMEQELQPGKLALQDMQKLYYGQAKESLMAEQAQKTALYHEQMLRLAEANSQHAEVLSDVNNVYQSVGLPGGVTDVNKLPPVQRGALMELGANLRTTNQFSPNAGKSIQLLQDAGIPLTKIAPSQIPTVQNLDELYQRGVTEALTLRVGEQRPTGKILEDRVNAFVQNELIKEQNGGYSASNKFYSLPSVAQTMELPWAQNNPIIQALKPLTVDGNGSPVNRPMDGNLIINTAARLISEGKLTENQAVAALKDYGFNTLNDGQKAGGYYKLGIPVQEKFPIMYNKSGFSFGSSSNRVDLYSSASVLSVLRAQIAGTRAEQLGAGGGFGAGTTGPASLSPESARDIRAGGARSLQILKGGLLIPSQDQQQTR